MPREASILVTLRDNYSAGVQAMRQANQDFGKSSDEVSRKLQGYETRLESLVKQQGQLSVELADARPWAAGGGKAFRATGDAADAEAVDKARQKYEGLKIVMKETADASRVTQNAMRQLNNQNLDMAAVQAAPAASAPPWPALGKAGLGQMAGDAGPQRLPTP